MPPRKTTTSAVAQDKPFIYKSETGAVITISSTVSINPDMDLMSDMLDMKDRVEGKTDLGELTLGEAQTRFVTTYYKWIKACFPADVAATIRLKMNELDDFMFKYQAHSGVDLPK